MRFAYEAMGLDGRTVSDSLDAAGRPEAVDALRAKGLMILRLVESVDGAAAAPAAGWTLQRGRAPRRALVLFSRQMKMLLESGASLVPALTAAEEQGMHPAMRAALGRIREKVEGGKPLALALEDEGQIFDPVFRSIVAAGEATATLPQAFGRLALLLEQQQRTTKLVLGAVLYPLLLTVLIVSVLIVLLFFVVPRFRGLFSSMHAKLPATTAVLFMLSDTCRATWPLILAGLGALIAAGVLLWRWRPARIWRDEVTLRLPYIGSLARRLALTRVMRIWAAMLRCRMPLLETIQQSRHAVTNGRILERLTTIEEAVAAGGRLGPAIGAAGLADRVIVSALQIGEDNGRLGEATEFVSAWLDEDTANAVQQVAKLAEPVLLSLMGVLVGFVAMALFLPLFDMATMTH